MSVAHLEHVNFTVENSAKTAKKLVDLFDWKIRWQGLSLSGGYTYHVGNDDFYLAVFNRKEGQEARNDGNPYDRIGRLNHIGIVVDDLEAIETRIKKAGYKTFSHGDYEPGRRFYFYDDDGIEFEIISYAPAPTKQSAGFRAELKNIALAGMARN